MPSNNTFVSPFDEPLHDPLNDSQALGCFTTCEGPPAEPRVSTVTKLRRQIASAFGPKEKHHDEEHLRSRPFDPDIVILDFVPENERPSTAPRLPPPSQTPPRPPRPPPSQCLYPFDPSSVSPPFIPDSVPERNSLYPGLRHFASHAAIANSGRSLSPASQDSSTASQPEAITSVRPTTAVSEDKSLSTDGGRSDRRTVRFQLDDHKSRLSVPKACSYPCTDHRCKTKRLSSKIRTMLGSPASSKTSNRFGAASDGEARHSSTFS